MVHVNERLLHVNILQMSRNYAIDCFSSLFFFYRSMLYCVLTRRAINRTQEEVLRHVGGFRFFKRYQRHLQKQEEQKEKAVADDQMAVDEVDEEMWVPTDYVKRENKAKKRNGNTDVCIQGNHSCKRHDVGFVVILLTYGSIPWCTMSELFPSFSYVKCI